MADLLVNQELYLNGHLFTDAQLAAIISSGTDASLTAAFGEAQVCGALPSSGKDQFIRAPH